MNTKPLQNTAIGIVLCIFCIIISYKCNSYEAKELKLEIVSDYDGNQFVGSITCQSCHEQMYSDHLETAHYLTSKKADKSSILGSFEDNNNHLELKKGIVYKMVEENGQLYQAVYINGTYLNKVPFHIIVGSGVKGQSYLYWHQNTLSQLPVSYSQVEKSWVNSPGYVDNKVQMNRSIIPTCLTCHTTFAKNIQPDDFFSPAYDKKQVILGIQCESCHGPSSKHVDFHQQNPNEKNPEFILDITKLSRQQRLDACAKCHSGLREPIKRPFSFKTGDVLDEFTKANYLPEEINSLDVHGNQYGLLTSSKCFIESETMDCSSCHNPHRKERQNLKLYSQRCMECHQEPEQIHKSSYVKESVSTNNCIDCHMPKLPSSVLTIQSQDLTNIDSLLVRTHRIAVYEKASEDLMEYIKKLTTESKNR
ncbi:hypothetical protein LV716_13925 [Flagellimonas sp. HMM57]|uniref:multiheme c-type cytochrome n=1 Tax=unclassified Flagellimonas TaxID=2644544 RepID=UPI0013D657A0|nr:MULTISPECIES: multiheme c-type cytochrome [unclassified Flagellimonas]UII75345.1 hypothetical protein LV716_13925 [Flagellimonas sp. HMM57]